MVKSTVRFVFFCFEIRDNRRKKEIPSLTESWWSMHNVSVLLLFYIVIPSSRVEEFLIIKNILRILRIWKIIEFLWYLLSQLQTIQELDGINGKSSIPIGQWPQSSMSDQQSHLLQGVRLSGRIISLSYSSYQCSKIRFRWLWGGML